MRQCINPQMQLGEVDISAVTFNLKSRDDIPRLLRAFQHIYTHPELRQQVFDVLETMITASRNNGRPGMSLWNILVFGTLRLVTNCDYDRLQELTVRSGRASVNMILRWHILLYISGLSIKLKTLCLN